MIFLNLDLYYQELVDIILTQNSIYYKKSNEGPNNTNCTLSQELLEGFCQIAFPSSILYTGSTYNLHE